MLILNISVVAFSQSINEPIPTFTERLFSLSKSDTADYISKYGITLFSKNELISMGISESELNRLIVGVNMKSMITCRIETDDMGLSVQRVIIGGVRYLNSKYLANEYQKAGYVLDENASKSNYLMFVRPADKYIYVRKYPF